MAATQRLTFAITGSASGIGAATARRLEAQGHRVVGIDIRNADVIADLGTPEGRNAMVEKVRALAPEGLDGVLACAGASDPDRPAFALSTNYFGSVQTFLGLHPLLRKPGARCVAVASVGALQAGAQTAELERLCLAGDEQAARQEAERIGSMLVYPGTKHALSVWARRTAVRPEWGGAGIALNIIAPGVIRTPMTEKSFQDPAVAEKIRQSAPRAVENVGEAEDVAEMLDFLLTCKTNYLIGQVIYFDGGTEALLRPDL